MSSPEASVFDKDWSVNKQRRLVKLAVATGRVEQYPSGSPSQSDAVDELLIAGASLVLVHLDQVAWSQLLERLPPNRNAVRFSTDGFRPMAPAGRNQNGFVCCRRIDDMGSPDFVTLLDAFANPTIVNALHQGRIPKELLGIFQFRPSAILTSLHILLQLVVKGPGAADSSSATSATLMDSNAMVAASVWNVLGLASPPTIVELTKVLADEIGDTPDSFRGRMPMLTDLLEAMIGSGPETVLEKQRAAGAFHELSKALGIG